MEYCVICKPHPNPKHSVDTRHVCAACEDPTISIKGPHEITKQTGLLQGDMDNITFGYSRSLDTHKYYLAHNKVNRYYSIKSIIDNAKEIFKDYPKRMKKLEKFKQNWSNAVKAKGNDDIRKGKLLDNVKLNIQKFDTVIDFNDAAVKEIIEDGFLDLNLTDAHLIHSLTTDLENHTYYLARKASLDKLIDEQIPEYYRLIIREMVEYDDYLFEYRKTDEHLAAIYDLLYQKYKLQEAKDNRQTALINYMNNITNAPELTTKLLTLHSIRWTFDRYVLDNTGQFPDICNNIHESIKPVIEKYHQLIKLKAELTKWEIEVSIHLGLINR